MRHHRFAVLTLSLLCLLVAAPSSAATDDYGYDMFSSRTGETRFLDTVWQGTVLPELDADGETAPIDLAFPFKYYGRTYDRAVINEDGWLGLIPAKTGATDGVQFARSLEEVRQLLADRDVPEVAAEPDAWVEVLHTDWVRGENSRIQYAMEDHRLTVRWIRMTTPDGMATASFEAMLHPEGAVTFQYLEVRDPQGVLEDVPRGTRPATGDGFDLRGPAGPLSGGTSLMVRPPLREMDPVAQYLPGDCPDIDGDTVPDNDFPSWCTQNPATCSVNAGQAGECLGEDCTDCNELVSTRWAFDEGNFCAGCVYTYFVLVECGTEMHIPMFDMEGARLRIADALTGDYLGVRGENECYKDSIDPNAPYPQSAWYCDGCAFGAGVVPRKDAQQQLGGDCIDVPLPTLPCTIYEEETTPADPEVCWGEVDNCVNAWPSPPCINNTGICPDGSNSNLAHEGQETDVVLTDQDGLCGVFRVEIISGGFEWFLFANCDGLDREQFRIFRNCGDALAAWNPLPEYTIDDVILTGDCPTSPQDPNRPAVEVTIRNIGCCDETGDVDSNPCQTPGGTIPVTVFWEDPNAPGTTQCPGPNADLSWPGSIDADQLKQKSGTNGVVSITYDCDSTTLPARAIVTLDPTAGGGDPGAVLECNEEPGAASCGSVDVAILDVDVCACDFFLVPDLLGPSDICIVDDPNNPGTTIGTVDLDASGSFANPACPNPEYRFYQLDWDEQNNPDPNIRRLQEVTNDPTNPTSPTADAVQFNCAEGENYAFEVEYSCADEQLDPVNCPKLAVITGACGVGDPVVVTADLDFDGDPSAETICGDQPIAMTPLIRGSAPIAPVNWRAELRDCADPDTPGTDYPEAMTNCTPNAHVLECNGFPPGVGCGECVAYIAETLNQRDCAVSDSFLVRVIDDPQPVVACNLRVNKRDLDAEADNLDLEFTHNFPSPPILCPGSPSSEVVEYSCTGSDYSTCGPNGLPPGNGEFDLTNMESDGTVVASVDGGLSSILYEDQGFFSGTTTVTYYQIRALNACEGPGPLGLGGGQPGSFGCP